MDFLVRAGLKLASSAIALLIAAVVLDKFNIKTTTFLVAVVIFTVVSMILEPITRSLVKKHAQAWTALVGLAVTWLTLLITDIFSTGLSIEGIGTWIIGTAIVWGVTAATDLVFDGVIARRNRRIRAERT